MLVLVSSSALPTASMSSRRKTDVGVCVNVNIQKDRHTHTLFYFPRVGSDTSSAGFAGADAHFAENKQPFPSLSKQVPGRRYPAETPCLLLPQGSMPGGVPQGLGYLFLL